MPPVPTTTTAPEGSAAAASASPGQRPEEEPRDHGRQGDRDGEGSAQHGDRLRAPRNGGPCAPRFSPGLVHPPGSGRPARMAVVSHRPRRSRRPSRWTRPHGRRTAAADEHGDVPAGPSPSAPPQWCGDHPADRHRPAPPVAPRGGSSSRSPRCRSCCATSCSGRSTSGRSTSRSTARRVSRSSPAGPSTPRSPRPRSCCPSPTRRSPRSSRSPWRSCRSGRRGGCGRPCRCSRPPRSSGTPGTASSTAPAPGCRSPSPLLTAPMLWLHPVSDGIRFGQVNAFMVLACLMDLREPRPGLLRRVPRGRARRPRDGGQAHPRGLRRALPRHHAVEGGRDRRRHRRRRHARGVGAAAAGVVRVLGRRPAGPGPARPEHGHVQPVAARLPPARRARGDAGHGALAALRRRRRGLRVLAGPPALPRRATRSARSRPSG